MAALPDYVTVLFNGLSDEPDPSVMRTAMDRGMPKQSIKNSQTLCALSGTLLFKSQADVNAFEDWWRTDIKRIGFFDVRHPRTGAIVSMRFRGGAIGQVVPLKTSFAIASRPVVLEYMA